MHVYRIQLETKHFGSFIVVIFEDYENIAQCLLLDIRKL